MVVGEQYKARNYAMFEQIGRTVNDAIDMDPARAFDQAVPGFLGDLFESMGPWRGREQMDIEFTGASNKGRAVSKSERAQKGDYDKKRIVALPGERLAGFTHDVMRSDFDHGGMSQAEVTRRVLRPRQEFNQLVYEDVLMDTALQGAFTSGTNDFTEKFAWTATDFNDKVVTKKTITESATEVADVVAHSGQTIGWPLRDGSETAAGHDHVLSAQGAAWTLALGAAARDNLTEHMGNGLKVNAIVGKNVAEDIRAVMKSELGAVESRREFINQGHVGGGGLANSQPIVESLEGVSYMFSPDIPDDVALYYAGNKKPFYLSLGATGADGQALETGFWQESSNPEIPGTSYGYRQICGAGVKDPVAVVLAEYTA